MNAPSKEVAYSDITFFSTFQYPFIYGTLKYLCLIFTLTSFVENKLIYMHNSCMGL